MKTALYTERTHVLIVEDDIYLAEGIKMNLKMAGLDAECVYNLEGAAAYLDGRQWDLVLADINLPDGEGTELIGRIRLKEKIPVIFLTARDSDEDVIRGFEAGADDYITKPFNVQILIQRIRAVLRRYKGAGTTTESDRAEQTGSVRQIGNLRIDLDGHEVRRNGEVITLTRTEFRILSIFCENPGIVLTREVLLEALWDKDGNFVDEHNLTVFVSRLRTKISDEKYSYIKTVYGTGYRWIGEGEA